MKSKKWVRPRATEQEHEALNLVKKVGAEEAIKILSQHKALLEECNNIGIPIEDVSQYWHKSEHFSIFAKNTKSTDYLQAVKDIIGNWKPDKVGFIPKKTPASDMAVKLVISDAHIGLDPNPDGDAIFNYKYGEMQFYKNLLKAYSAVIEKSKVYGKFDLLLIDDLGDGLDGYNGYTTRGGHKLEQNMTNRKAFDVYVKGKLELIERCIKSGVANEYIIRNVTNSNHDGSFSEIANSAIAMILQRAYGEDIVQYNILTKFMEHFTYGDHCFILTHGKDRKYMKSGMPLKLDDKTKNFINAYIDHHKITSKYIHVDKGDLHQASYQKTTRFDYRNYMSFAPPSAWVQHNFGDAYSGFSVQVINKNNPEISHTDYFLDFSE